MNLHYVLASLCFVPAQAMLHKKFALGVDGWADRVNPAVYQEDSAADVQLPTSVLASSGAQKYMIASFPQIRQVAYCMLPDNVFYPLVLGEVVQPMAIAVDQQASRLFVADPPNRVIWWYKLSVGDDGFMVTTGDRWAAVQNITAHWIAVNSVGDLYFTGTQGTGNTSTVSVWRQDARDTVVGGNPFGAKEVYNRDTSGAPDPSAWVPSGIAVDALYIYWGNEIGGRTHGSVVKATRTNIGVKPQAQSVDVLSKAVSNVRGMTATGTHIFYTSPQGVYGVLKTAPTPVNDPEAGLVVSPLSGDTSAWNPTNIAWDGDSTLYFAETSTGVVYTIPSLSTQQQRLTKHVDAPGAFGISIISFSSNGAFRQWGLRGVASAVPFLLALSSMLLATTQC